MALFKATAILPPASLEADDAVRVLGEIGRVEFDTYSIRVSLDYGDDLTDAALRMARGLDELLHEADLADNVDQFIIQVKTIPEKEKYA